MFFKNWKFSLSLGTIHLRSRQIFTILDPYPPTVSIPAKCLWRGLLILIYCDLLTIGTWWTPLPPKTCWRLKWMVPKIIKPVIWTQHQRSKVNVRSNFHFRNSFKDPWSHIKYIHKSSCKQKVYWKGRLFVNIRMKYWNFYFRMLTLISFLKCVLSK